MTGKQKITSIVTIRDFETNRESTGQQNRGKFNKSIAENENHTSQGFKMQNRDIKKKQDFKENQTLNNLEVKKKREILKPFAYYGGKQTLLPELLKLIPEHETYVEIFGGSGTLLFNKKPSKVEIYNDLNGDIVNFFRVLRNNPDELIRLLQHWTG